jgi:hypothetical protein
MVLGIHPKSEGAMKSVDSKSAFLGILVLLCASILIGSSGQAGAEDPKAISSAISKELRQAERDMFGGKTDKAIAALPNIRSSLDQLREIDPNNTSLNTYESKYAKLVRDLERRTGEDLGGGTVTAAGTSTETDLPDKPVGEAMPEDAATPTESAGTAAKVPYSARKPLSNATRLLDSLERNLTNLADPEYGGDKDQLVGNIEAKLTDIESALDQAKALAAEKGVTTHPDFDDVEARLSDAKSQVAQAKGDYSEAKAAAAATSEEVTADVNALKAEYDQVSSIFDAATGYVIYYNDLEPVENLIVQIEEFEQSKLPGLQPKMDAFAAKYGIARDEIDSKADAMGYSGQFRASLPYTELMEGIENVKKTRAAMAEDLVDKGTGRLSGMESLHDFAVADRLNNIKAWLEMSARYDPANPKVTNALANIDGQIDEAMKALNARIDARTWPDHASNAPKNANELAEAALDWFKNSPDWGKRSEDARRPLDVVVTGPWSVQKKNLLGEPIMYGLPILLAVEVPSDRELNVARVYVLTMRTAEMRGVKMEPPFDHITVGDSYYIRPSEVK